MEIYLNGEIVETNSSTIAQLINEKQLDADGVVVELNLDIIKKQNWKRTEIKNGDKIELVTFVGGG